MFNPHESAAALHKYFKKLAKIITNEATFTFMETKIVNKARIDDILCCIDGTFPEDYKAYTKKRGAKKLQSNVNYVQLLKTIKNKFALSSSYYSVRYKQALAQIDAVLMYLSKDIEFVYSDESGMF